jgi:hypothetical protein
MKKNILFGVAALLLSAANLAYANRSTMFAVCSDYRCSYDWNCTNLSITCNICFPYPGLGARCINFEEQ